MINFLLLNDDQILNLVLKFTKSTNFINLFGVKNINDIQILRFDTFNTNLPINKDENIFYFGFVSKSNNYDSSLIKYVNLNYFNDITLTTNFSASTFETLTLFNQVDIDNVDVSLSFVGYILKIN